MRAATAECGIRGNNGTQVWPVERLLKHLTIASTRGAIMGTDAIKERFNYVLVRKITKILYNNCLQVY